MNIIIAGNGLSVYFLAKRFISKGYKTTIVSNNENDCDYYARYLKAVIIKGDCSDPEILTQAEVHFADLFVAMNAKDQDNLVACQLAKLYFKVRRILAVINDPENEPVFEKLGLKAISTSKFLIDIIDNLAVLDEIKQQIPLIEGKVLITEVDVSEQAKCANKELKNISIPYGALIATILRLNEVIIPRGNTLILPKDKLLLITLPDNHNSVLNDLL